MASSQVSGVPLGDLPEGISLYIHIPFCKTKCPYCDFNTYQGIEVLMPEYVQVLATEIAQWGIVLGRPLVNTIFFGGGTPSYLPSDAVATLLDTVSTAFRVVPGAEITLEANPGDLNPPALQRLLSAGANRLSMGVQSLDDALLRLLGRRHSAAEAEDAYRLAVEAGFHRVNLDLMYGLPQQTTDQWADTLDRAVEMGPPHLSLYCLTLEEGTPLEAWVREGKFPTPDPDLAADMYLHAQHVLSQAGYHHYEISNWSRPGFECLHNLVYWRNRPYLGVGPGAHSYLGGLRFSNVAPPRLYMRRVRAWVSRAEAASPAVDASSLKTLGAVGMVEPIGPRLEMAETMFLGLRLLDGLSLREFQLRFGRDPLEVYGAQVRELVELGLLEQSDGVLRLTPRGCLLANQVFVRFLD